MSALPNRLALVAFLASSFLLSFGSGAVQAAPEIAATTRGNTGGPQLVDDGRVAWLETGTADWRIQATAAGTTQGTTVAGGGLRSEDGGDDDGYYVSQSAGNFHAAGTIAVVELSSSTGTTKYRQYDDSATVVAYSLKDGSRKQLSDCSVHIDDFGGDGRSAAPSASAQIATDGTHTAVSQCGRIRVFDAAGETVATFAEPTAGVSIAGPYLATRTGPAVVVRDWATGAERYRVAVPAAAQRASFAVQPDAALALLGVEGGAEPCTGNTLTWHTPAIPTGIALPVAACDAGLKVDGDRALVRTKPAGLAGFELTEVGPKSAPRRLGWLGSSSTTDFGYLGGAAVYGIEGCDGSGTIIRSTGDAPPVATDCPVLAIQGARRKGRTLTLKASIRPGTTGAVELRYRVRGHAFYRSLKIGNGDLRRSVRLPRWAAAKAAKRARLTLTYAGDQTFVGQTLERGVAR